jgi:hypothetical protein
MKQETGDSRKAGMQNPLNPPLTKGERKPKGSRGILEVISFVSCCLLSTVCCLLVKAGEKKQGDSRVRQETGDSRETVKQEVFFEGFMLSLVYCLLSTC